MAEQSDGPFLVRLFLDAMKECITAARGGWDEGREIAQFQRQLVLDSRSIILRDTREVGFVMIVESGRETQIHTLCVAPDCQGHGIGTHITRQVIQQARERKHDAVLSVWKVNTRARGLYERLGFSVESETEHHYHMRFGEPPTDG
jgi:ribosomal protein S18 acetylase RimI-like enzyme